MNREQTPTVFCGRLTTPPDAQGWQVTYEIAAQGEELVVTGVSLESDTPRDGGRPKGEYKSVPRGGLAAQKARSLIKTGAAVQAFIESVLAQEKPTVSDERMSALWERHGGGRAEPTPAFRQQARLMQVFPQILVTFGTGKKLPRRQRIAQTAALYVEALHEGRSDPRPHVAKQQRRDVGAVRDDLHAARAESPRLLTGAGLSGRAGGELTEEARRILAEMQSGAKPRAKRKKGKAR